MLSNDDLLSLIADHESDRVERTVSTNNTDKFGEAICAFANDFPATASPATCSSAFGTVAPLTDWR